MAQGAAMDWRAVMAPGGRHSALVTTGSSPLRVARNAVGLAYLSAPYAGEVALRGDWRFDRSVRILTCVSREMLRLAKAGCYALSPVMQQAEMAQVAPLARQEGIEVDPLADPVWRELAVRMRQVCGLVVVPDLQGWDRCPAVRADVAWALERNVPVHLYAERPS